MTDTRAVSRTAAHRRFDWLAALLLLALGVVGGWYVVATTRPVAGRLPDGLPAAVIAQASFDSPNVGAMATLLLSTFAAALGGGWFVIAVLHWRFRPTVKPWTVWRQALWVALSVAIFAWLQLSRALNIVLAALIAGGFALIEVFLSVRERSE